MGLSFRRVVITGGAGFLGTHLAERLAPQVAVTLFDSFRRDALSLAPDLAARSTVKVITGDVLDRASLAPALDGADVVIHCAAVAGVSSYYAEPLRTLQVNLLGTVNVLEEAVKHRVKRFIYFSTSEIFGPEARNVHETSPHHIGPVSDARWVYATSKLAGEQFTARYADQYGFAYTIVRPFNIYGPRQVGEGAISNFCRAASRRQPLIVHGDGAAVRAWCYVSDFVDAVEAMLRAPAAAGQAFNIGNPRAVETTLGLARRVVQLLPGSSIEFREAQRTDVRARVPVIDHAHAILGFEPNVDLEEGLQRTLTWFKQESPAPLSA